MKTPMFFVRIIIVTFSFPAMAERHRIEQRSSVYIDWSFLMKLEKIVKVPYFSGFTSPLKMNPP